MGARRASRRRHHRQHNTDVGTQKRALKYVQKELKRMRLHNGGQGMLHGFRVHPEFGWCHKALHFLGYAVDMRSTVLSRKQRNLIRMPGNAPKHFGSWCHVKNKGLVEMPDIEVTIF